MGKTHELAKFGRVAADCELILIDQFRQQLLYIVHRQHEVAVWVIGSGRRGYGEGINGCVGAPFQAIHHAGDIGQ